MTNHLDTIAAVSTPPGTGGIAVIRLSGTNSLEIINKVFRSKIAAEEMESHHIYFGRIFDSNELIDEVLVSYFKNPNSFTGEDVIEISCHGGAFVTQRVLETILKRGARSAEKGEFTKRAFLNGKIDLTEAEAIIDLIHSSTKHSLESAIYQLEGKLHDSISIILDEITAIRTEIELDIDFSDQGLGSKKFNDYGSALNRIQKSLKKLIKTAHEGRILHEGYRVVIAGPPNAGKSSVFNKLIENERSIVTDIPGTTRDYIEEDIALEGYLVKLFDTAGLRDDPEHIERYGIEKSLKIIGDAHLVIWIKDCTVSRETSLPNLDGINIIQVLNKVDLLGVQPKKEKDLLYVSAIDGTGIEELKKRMINNIDISNYDISGGFITNARQLAAAEKSLKALCQAIDSADSQRGLEFIAFDLKESSEYLEEIIGKISSEEIINSIFDRFCVGK
ncbi:MAG: tRNA uridine-5-carboxymethylaminomethyl(34) synthesis GTPase MnmE [Candidatus Cloacimonetes bacterium]|nr:tRNA uridine-5-carboxymethylaminomethyl(34) synthesis GTPase MnmE [Candidatus Cloacimonadota bacterium]